MVGSTQPTTITVQSNIEHPFYLYLNGEQINKIPTSKVEAHDLVLTDYQMRIEFRDITQPILKETVKPKSGKNSIYKVKIDTLKKQHRLELYETLKPSDVSEFSESYYHMPDYEGKLGCAWPVDESEHEDLLNNLKGQEIEAPMLFKIRSFVSSRCLTVDQFKPILALVEEEHEKEELAKFAYSYLYDRENFSELYSEFQYSQTVADIKRYIQKHTGNRR
jgi:hypothetical protein